MDKEGKKALNKDDVRNAIDEFKKDELQKKKAEQSGMDYLYDVIADKVNKDGRRNLLDVDGSRRTNALPLTN